jgi:NTE family protein
MAKIHLPPYQQVVLIFQGGGSLGAYQAGVYEGIAEAGIEPTWVSGISIGSINAAIVAGNPPEKRVERLHDFWDTVCRPPSMSASFATEALSMMGAGFAPFQESLKHTVDKAFGSYAATMAILEGQNEFFYPRPFAPGFGNPSQVSFYDTSPLKSTLERLVDFDRINHKDSMRISLGSTNVGTGNFVFFDNRHMKIGPEHIMASGSLPPGFPATEIDGEYYWDGGCVSNTPLLYIMNEGKNQDSLIFQVDLWSAHGKLPSNIFEVTERQKDIQYSSRTRAITDLVRNMHRMRQLLLNMVDRIPPAVRKADPYFDQIAEQAMGSNYNVIQLIYQNKFGEGHYKDAEFSSESMERHWAIGLEDFENTLADRQCLAMPPKGENFVTYDVHRKERFTAESPDPTANRNAFADYAFHSGQGQAHKPGNGETAKKTAAKKPAAKKPAKPADKKVAAKR